MIRRFLERLAPFFRSALVVLVATFFVTSIVYAATTVGTNITTGGNLTVSGTTSTTNATTTGYLYVGGDITEPTGWDFGVGDLIVSDDVFFNSQATTSASLWIGSAGTANNLSMTGGDLYVQDDVEIDGGLWMGSATTTDSLKIGGYASTTGDLIVGGGTIDLNTSTATTTGGMFVRNNNTATSTLSVGSVEGSDTVTGCLELVGSNGQYYFCGVDTTTPTNGLSCGLGRCGD